MIVAVSWSALEPGNVAHEVGRGQLRVAFCCVGWFMLLLRDRNGGAGGGEGRGLGCLVFGCFWALGVRGLAANQPRYDGSRLFIQGLRCVCVSFVRLRGKFASWAQTVGFLGT